MNLASRGLRDMDSGAEKIEDPAELAKIRAQAMRVHVRSIASAAAFAVVIAALPR